MKTTTVTIPGFFTKLGRDLVAMPRRQYEKLMQTQWETEDALKKIRRGNRDLKRGKTRRITSVRELM